MRTKRFSPLGMLAAVLLTAIATAALILGVLWALLGSAGLGMAEAMVLINTRFVGEHDIGYATDQAMAALITGLGDRWSYYLDAESYERQQDSRDNVYVGLGMTVSYPEGEGLLVEAVAEGGPADQAGITAGDLVLEVDGKRMDGEARSRASEYTQGPEGSQVELLLRGPDNTERRVTLARARVQEHPVSYELLADGTGLVTIKNFNRRCAEETIAAVDELVEQGAARLVFDVRNNGGGYLDELTELLDYLLPEGIIFRSENKQGWGRSVHSDAACVELPMAVLVNGGTYSAAEFFAAQIQEMDWGVIVGSPTSGKGFSQQTYPLLSGGAINISTGKYFTGDGISLIGTGLTLDQEVGLTEEQDAALKNRVLPPEEDPQLQAAVDLIS